MDILSYSFLILLLIFCFNALLKNCFDKLTICGNTEFCWLPTWFILTFMLFGFLMFPFYKSIREYRKILYIKNKIRQFEWCELFMKVYIDGDMKGDKSYEEYLIFKRYLKLKKLKRKI